MSRSKPSTVAYRSYRIEPPTDNGLAKELINLAMFYLSMSAALVTGILLGAGVPTGAIIAALVATLAYIVMMITDADEPGHSPHPRAEYIPLIISLYTFFVGFGIASFVGSI